MRAATVSRRERDGVWRRGQCSPDRSERLAPGAVHHTVVGPAASLDEVMKAAWAGLRADAPIACPWCDARMDPLWSAGAGVVGGRCRECGAELG